MVPLAKEEPTELNTVAQRVNPHNHSTTLHTLSIIYYTVQYSYSSLSVENTSTHTFVVKV